MLGHMNVQTPGPAEQDWPGVWGGRGEEGEFHIITGSFHHGRKFPLKELGKHQEKGEKDHQADKKHYLSDMCKIGLENQTSH